MLGRRDLKPKECKDCHGSGKSPKNRKKMCSLCEGSGTMFICTKCGGIYGVECKDIMFDQTECSNIQKDLNPDDLEDFYFFDKSE
jgi:RecJ-like exonuclease